MKTTRRLTAVALVLLLLLSLCGCMAEEPSPADQGGTTAAPTQVTTTDSSAPTTTATDTQPTTAETTAETTVAPTTVTTKAPPTAATTTTTASPTTTVPQKPAIEWNVTKGELPEDGITPGVEFPCGKVKGYCIDNPEKYVKGYQQRFGEIIESTAELHDLVWNTKEFQEIGGYYALPIYDDAFFEESVLVEFMCSTRWEFRSSLVGSVTLDGDTLHLYLMHEIFDVYETLCAMRDVRVLVEMKREDAAKVKEIIVYQNEVLV